MRCPDWSSLVAHRYRTDGVEPAGWWKAVAHLKGCERCRREALLADPTLLFVDRLTVEPAAEPPIRAREVVALASRGRPGARFVPRSWLAAAAALVLAVGLIQGARHLALSDGRSALPVAATAEASMAAQPVGIEMPLVESLDNDTSRLYQVAAGEIDFVLIVDEGLELLDESLDL